jgi:hypothetical protein
VLTCDCCFVQGSRNLVYPICAPAAVRLDAETGLSPLPDIAQQPYEHIPNPEPACDPDVDVGSGPMSRQRTTSLSNPLFESVGAVPSQLTAHDSISEAAVHEGENPLATEAVVVDSQASPVTAIAETASPLTGVTIRSCVIQSLPIVFQREMILSDLQSKLGSGECVI